MKHSRSPLTLVLSLALSSAAALAADPLPRVDPAKVGFSAAALERIDRFFADEIARDRVPGAVVAIAREGRLVYYKPSDSRTSRRTCRCASTRSFSSLP